MSAAFAPRDIELIRQTVDQAGTEVRGLLPDLVESITVTVVAVDRDLSTVGGTSGRADAPGEVLIEVSTQYRGGASAMRGALRKGIFHEFHHLWRGWTIRGNRFGAGIQIAAINEGLADVFAELYTGVVHPANAYPEEVSDWALEIRALPRDADYWTWMGEHPDGRLAIGYRTGRYVVLEALERSGKTILELSTLVHEEVWRLSGVLDR